MARWTTLFKGTKGYNGDRIYIGSVEAPSKIEAAEAAKRTLEYDGYEFLGVAFVSESTNGHGQGVDRYEPATTKFIETEVVSYETVEKKVPARLVPFNGKL